MFERAHHQRIAQVLLALNGPLLHAHRCLFGGGTAIALRHGEYRESVDLDFLVSDRDGYRHLRELLTSAGGIANVARDGAVLKQTRELRADQYGIRTALGVDGHDIKFEVLLEGRIELAPPGRSDVVCGVATLTPTDLVASKLLANADRWPDDGAFSRDLIDLAMMAPTLALLRTAIAKAEQAYGSAVLDDLGKAIEQLKTRDSRLERCMQAMAIQLPKAVLWQRIRALERVLPKSRIG